MDAPGPAVSPLVGHTLVLDFGEQAFRNTFDSDTRMTFVPIRGGVGQAQTVDLTSVELRPNVYFQFWQEEDGTTVTRVLDMGGDVVHGNITLPDNTFLTLQGTVKRID